MIASYHDLQFFCLMSTDCYHSDKNALLHNLNLEGVAENDLTFFLAEFSY